jgi:hypothetical protein
MQRFEPWSPAPGLTGRFYDAEIVANDGGLVVTLISEAGSVHLRFSRVPAFRCILEECLTDVWPTLPRLGTAGACWIVRESNWLREFSDADLLHYPNCVHYFLTTGDRCIDVLSQKPPVVKSRP